MHIAGKRGEISHLADVLLLVEHGLVEVGDGPAFRNVVLEEFRELLMSFGCVGVLPSAEWDKQLAVLVKGEVAVHHGGEADVPHMGQFLAVSGFHVAGHLGVCGLQARPDLLLGVAPQAVFQMAGPAVIAGGDGVVFVIDKHRLDSGRSEFDAQARLACADFLGGQRNRLLRHSSKLLASERLVTTLSTEC